ncbi:MFS transporter [Streptomyces armeniacus]|uniref:MFS transporter n=1 Tax=Streptomyces armeniacus TaxID=83291 RepID=UPI001C9ADC7B|nr:MFS transporter [Streptomyces armeniacus]
MNIKAPPPPAPDPVARRARAGVFGYFVINGFVMGMWASGLPALDDRLGLGPARLGSVLLLVSGGALASMLIAGRLVDTWSSARVCRAAGPVSAAVLLGPALAGSYAWLTVLAVLFGLGVGIIEVAMNAHSVEVEHRYGRPIVSAFHGVWSLGGAAAGGLTTVGLKAGADGRVLLIAVALAVPLAFLPAARALLPPAEGKATEGKATEGKAAKGEPETEAETEAETDSADVGNGTALRWGLVTLLGIVAFAGHMSEGAAMDWAALHARWVLDVDPAIAPLAYMVFAVAMTTVRLLGDPVRARLGAVRTIQLAGLHATAGYVLILTAPFVPEPLRVACAWTGWAFAGIGLATVVPVLFSTVGASGGAVGRALALVTACGYTGLLLGPAVLGYVAEHTSLRVALVIPAVMAFLVTAVGSPAVRRLLAVRPSRTVRTGGGDDDPTGVDDDRTGADAHRTGVDDDRMPTADGQR